MRTHWCAGAAGALALVLLCGLFGITAARAGVPGHGPSPAPQPILDSALDLTVDELTGAGAAIGAPVMMPRGLPDDTALRPHPFVDRTVPSHSALFPSQVTRTFLPPPPAAS